MASARYVPSMYSIIIIDVKASRMNEFEFVPVKLGRVFYTTENVIGIFQIQRKTITLESVCIR